jgi:hypothetical protein
MDMPEQPVNPVVVKIQTAIMHALQPEMMTIAGKHMQRENGTGPLRFVPGHTAQMLAADMQSFLTFAQECLLGTGLSFRIKDSPQQGVSLDLTVQVDPAIGANRAAELKSAAGSE